MSAPIPVIWPAVAQKIAEDQGLPMLRYHLQRAVYAVVDEATSRQAEKELLRAVKIIRAVRRQVGAP